MIAAIREPLSIVLADEPQAVVSIADEVADAVAEILLAAADQAQEGD